MRVVVALGGNALSPRDGQGSVEELRGSLDSTAALLADLVDEGTSLVLTHGNGPQVGRLLLQQEIAGDRVPPMPMDVCGALSQGQLGYLICQALDNALRTRGIEPRVLCLLTQVVVDADDPAFAHPSKPVGPSYPALVGQGVAEASGQPFAEQSDGSWRRLVASPRPVSIVECDPLRALADSGHVVVAAGGGGVPVVERDGLLEGVDAVVDKDLTAALLAQAVGADVLLVLTEVSQVQVGFGTPEARALQQLTLSEARRLLADGEFPEGSMGPKVEACCAVIEAGGRAAIGSLAELRQVLEGRAGTQFVAGP
jgi:carbamate kinase